MHRQAELLDKLAYLKAESHQDSDELFLPIENAIANYFQYDGMLEYEVLYCIHQMANDLINRATAYEKSTYAPKYPQDFPQGYEDITDIFVGGGAFLAIKTITLTEFLQGFDSLLPEVSPTENSFLLAWEKQINSARGLEISAIKAVSSFCDSAGLSSGLNLRFEDLGAVEVNITQKTLVERIYITGGFKELVEAMKLDVHIPVSVR